MSSFFTLPSSAKKRKRVEISEPHPKRFAPSKASTSKFSSKAAPRKPHRDESISGSDDESDEGPRQNISDEELSESGSGSEGEEETAAERRLRLAERYLQNVATEVETHGFDAEEIDRDLIAERLQEDAAESKGRLYRALANELQFEDAGHSFFRVNGESFTSVATCAPFAYTASKDITLVKWRIQDPPKHQWLPTSSSSEKKKMKRKQEKEKPPPKQKPEQIAFVRGDRKKGKQNSYMGHTDNILCIAASGDGKFVVTGGVDRKLIVWNASTLKPIKVFSQHRDSITGLAFRRGTNQLYSSSKDRTIKIWSLDELAYIETLFGHQDEVVDIAALAQERCVSVGARDRTARLWKVVEETQLVFRGGGGGSSKSKSKDTVLEGSMDRVAMIDEEMFVTGGDNGNLSLWTMHKKKPIFTLSLTHGVDPPLELEDVSAEVRPDEKVVPKPQPRWITALATIPYSDVILSGSWDGSLKAWRVSEDRKKIESMGVVGSVRMPKVNGQVHVNGSIEETHDLVKGVINDISVFERGERGMDGVCIVAAVGKEHRMGRWRKVAGKNGGVVFEVPRIQKGKMNGAVEGEGILVDR